MAHAIKLVEAFQLVDNEKPKLCQSESNHGGNRTEPHENRYASKSFRTDIRPTEEEYSKQIKPSRKPPTCVMPRCKAKKLRHFFSDCAEPKEEFEAMKQYLEKPPSSGTRA